MAKTKLSWPWPLTPLGTKKQSPQNIPACLGVDSKEPSRFHSQLRDVLNGEL